MCVCACVHACVDENNIQSVFAPNILNRLFTLGLFTM